jgi:hypothetical protein
MVAILTTSSAAVKTNIKTFAVGIEFCKFMTRYFIITNPKGK